MFLAQFMATRRRRRPTTHLMTLKQQESESLKDYVERFNKERLEVQGAPEKLVLAALFSKVLPQGPLIVELAQRMPTTLQDFMDKAEEFINAEETIRPLVESRVDCRVPPKRKKYSRWKGASKKSTKGPRRRA